MTAQDKDGVMKVDEVLKALNISRKTLYRLIREKSLQPININPLLKRQPHLEFSRADVEALLKK